ncbi:hypothetical protein EVAR_79465_1 [Eumeta japonica]|uniref:Uncharacterized protein n=1 Tax=Eumeta variegata TaxID=151549 RepID=A0A4C1UEM2_EUMVA|nr:hypothetical protein EVAR_79465_1 [Eumeta japonica]
MRRRDDRTGPAGDVNERRASCARADYHGPLVYIGIYSLNQLGNVRFSPYCPVCHGAHAAYSLPDWLTFSAVGAARGRRVALGSRTRSVCYAGPFERSSRARRVYEKNGTINNVSNPLYRRRDKRPAEILNRLSFVPPAPPLVRTTNLFEGAYQKLPDASVGFDFGSLRRREWVQPASAGICWEEGLKRIVGPEWMRMARDRDKRKYLEEAYLEEQSRGKKSTDP